MDHPIFLAELAAAIHDEFRVHAQSEILKRFLAWWFRSEEFPFHSDTTNEAFCEIVILQNGLGIRDITGYGEAALKSYGTSRYSLIGWLDSQGHLPAGTDWRTKAYNLSHDKAALQQLYNEFADAIENGELAGDYEVFSSSLVIRSSLAIRFLLTESLPIPKVIKNEISHFVDSTHTQGKKAGAEIQKGHCNNALDLLVTSGLYTPRNKGTMTAALLIFWIFKLGIRPDTIATHIRDNHRQLVKRSA